MSGTEAIILYLFIVLVVFMVLREFWCWYFKINKQTALLEEILEELKYLNKRNPVESNEDMYAANKIEVKAEKKQDEKKEEKKKDENEESDEPVEDPFWNKKN